MIQNKLQSKSMYAFQYPGDSWESPKAHLNQSQFSLVKNFAGPFPYQCVGISFAKVCLKAGLEAAVPSDDLRTLL